MPSLPCVVAFSLVDLKTFGPLALRSSPFYLVHPCKCQRFRIEPRLKVRIGRLAKVLSIFGPATEATDNSRGFFEGGSGSATPFEGFTSRKIAMKIPGASRSVGRGGAKNLRATCRRGPPHCRVRQR